MNKNLNYNQIKEIYSNKEKYKRELDNTQMDYYRLLIETVEWKIPNLMLVVPPSFSPKRVAEVGCFNGHLIGNISINGRNDFQKIGFDVNDKAINLAQKLYPDVEFYCEDIFDSHQSFDLDLLILSDIVEHIEDDVAFMKKCTKIADFILLNLPLEKSISNLSRKYGFDDPSGHLRAYNLGDAKKIIKSSGLSVINYHTVCVLNSKIFDKILDLKLSHNKLDNRSIFLKKLILSSVRTNSWLMKKYFGQNLFAFLHKS